MNGKEKFQHPTSNIQRSSKIQHARTKVALWFCGRFLGLAALFALAGCATPVNPNPPSPNANTGYVDFYCQSASGLSWDVYRFDQKAGKMKPAFSEYKPFPGNVLRVPTPPGKQRFQVGIWNKVNFGPQEVSVVVENGKVTPVKITLEHTGEITVERKEYGFRGSAKGYGRGTKIVSEQNDVVEIVPEAQVPEPYQSKEEKAYYRAGG